MPTILHIDERNVRNDWYFEIWWAEAKEAPEGDYWKDSDFIVVFYDSDGEEKPIGVLLVGHKKAGNSFSRNHLNSLAVLASFAALAVSNEQ